MSKDRYRPSTADYEVVETQGRGTVEEEVRDDLFQNENFEDPYNAALVAGVFRVQKQVVRYNAQGNMVVDVTFAWEPIAGVDEYRIRVTAA